ncbi:MAG TPA: GNAT family N-acetyltransferase [Roseiarcus sp.]|nr:GNAT family N-acetyltransferase [Roseiarcus sp.]
MTLAAPAPLANRHDLTRFDCGNASLDDWLKRRARANQISGATRTFVACDDNVVAGYYALAAGGVSLAAATGRFRRNMPDPIPVALLARLAVDHRWQSKGIGRALFRDAAMRLASAAETLGIRGVLVHAISDEAKAFYLSLGFDPSPLEPMMLMATMADIQNVLGLT